MVRRQGRQDDEDHRRRPATTTIIGALTACSDNLKLGHSPPWVFGASGHAFLLNLDRTFCKSHPTLWNMGAFHSNCANLGLELTGVSY